MLGCATRNFATLLMWRYAIRNLHHQEHIQRMGIVLGVLIQTILSKRRQLNRTLNVTAGPVIGLISSERSLASQTRYVNGIHGITISADVFH